MTFDALVLDAPLRQSLATVRCLGRRGLQVAVVGKGGEMPAFSSRWCRRAFVFPADEGTDAYLALLEEWLEHAGARVLIPSDDGTIALLRPHRARLERRVRLGLAEEPALDIADNKQRTPAAA